MHKSESAGRRSQRALRASTKSLTGIALLVSASATTSCGTAREDVSDGALVQSTHKIEWTPNYPGAPDPTFGGDGRVNMALKSGITEATAVTVQPDGKVVATGSTCGTEEGESCDGFLVRYLADGTLDTTFDGDGKVSAPLGLVDTWLPAIVVQSDGKILVGGLADEDHDDSNGNSANEAAVIARYNADGSPDTTFGTSGVKKIPHDDGQGRRSISALKLLPSGSILAVGEQSLRQMPGNGTSSTRTSDVLVMRLLADGTLDSAFGQGGIVTTSFEPTEVGTSNDWAVGVEVLPDGKFLVGGQAQYADGDRFALVRYNSDGSLDTGFGDNGRVTTRLSNVDGANATARDFVRQPDGKLVLAGDVEEAGLRTTDAALVRYNADGSLDQGFGTAGIVVQGTSNRADNFYTVAVQHDGRLLAGGYLRGTVQTETVVVRYNADGSVDSTFGNASTGRELLSGTAPTIWDMVVQENGRIVVAGSVYDETAAEEGFAVWRLNPQARGEFAVNSQHVGFDWRFDGGFFAGQVAIYNLAGMSAYDVSTAEGRQNYVKEAARRALTSSSDGYVVINDLEDKAKYDGPLVTASGTVLDDNVNVASATGSYLRTQAFAMNVGDRFGVMVVPQGTVQAVFDNPDITGTGAPLFSYENQNLNDQRVGVLGELQADGASFAFEDMSVAPDSDYNDYVFRVLGAQGVATSVDNLIVPEREWRTTEVGRKVLDDDVTAGLVGRWTFDETLNGRAGARAGSLLNGGSGPTYNRGSVGTAGLAFTGASNESLQIPFEVTSTALTVSTWVKVDENSPSGYIVQGTGGTAATAGIVLNSAGKVELTLNGVPLATSPNALAVGTWYHVVGTASAGGVATLYLNGAAVSSSGPLPAATSAGGTSLSVGGSGSAPSIRGTVDDVRVYNRALSGSDVTALYNVTY